MHGFIDLIMKLSALISILSVLPLAVSQAPPLATELGCSIQCSSNFLKAWALELNKEVGTFVSGNHQQTIENLASIVDAVKNSGKDGSVDILDKLCMLHKNNEQCLNGCEDELKSYMIRGLLPLKFLCEERLQAYKSNLECLAREDSNIRLICLKSSNELKLVQKHLQDLSTFPFTFRRNLTEQYCVLTRVHLNCTIGVIDSSCGHNASNVMIDILEKSLEHSDKVVDHEKLSFPLPSQCSRLMTYADELREMIRDEEIVTLTTQSSENEDVDDDLATASVARTDLKDQETAAEENPAAKGGSGAQIGDAENQDGVGAADRTSVMKLLVGVACVMVMVILNIM